MKIIAEYDSDAILELILEDMRDKIPGININEKHIDFKVMSKQNYRVHEWEHGKFKAEIDTGSLI